MSQYKNKKKREEKDYSSPTSGDTSDKEKYRNENKTGETDIEGSGETQPGDMGDMDSDQQNKNANRENEMSNYNLSAGKKLKP